MLRSIVFQWLPHHSPPLHNYSCDNNNIIIVTILEYIVYYAGCSLNVSLFSLSPPPSLPPARRHLQSRIQAQPDKGMLHGPCLWCICVGMMGGCASDSRTRSAQLVFITVIIILYNITRVTIVDFFSLFFSFPRRVLSHLVQVCGTWEANSSTRV